MSDISFIKPNYPGEKRVAILPHDVIHINRSVYRNIFIESSFGEYMGIDDAEYIDAGCKVINRKQCFEKEYVFSLKLIQKSDYQYLKKGCKLIGWMHPNGSGRSFCQGVARKNEIDIFDIDSAYPKLYLHDGSEKDVLGLPKHFFWKNSYYAGQASCIEALKYFSPVDMSLINVCVLGSGSVSQGAFQYLSSIGLSPRMFYRKTLPIFYELIDSFDLIVNGIEIDYEGGHILSSEDLHRTKRDAFIVDAAADAGGAVEGTEYLSIDNPISSTSGRRYFLINNAPTLLYERASFYISSVVSTHVLGARHF